MSDAVMVALIGAAALVVSTLLQRPSRRRLKATQEAAEKAVEQTEHTSNGFAKEVRTFIREMREFRRHSTAHGDFQDKLLVAIDDRVTKLEEKT